MTSGSSDWPSLSFVMLFSYQTFRHEFYSSLFIFISANLHLTLCQENIYPNYSLKYILCTLFPLQKVHPHLIHFVKVVLRNFPAIVHNEPLDFIAHSFLAGGAEVDFHPIGRVSDFLYNIGLLCFLYGQRGSVCGGAGFIAHRLSFP